MSSKDAEMTEAGDSPAKKQGTKSESKKEEASMTTAATPPALEASARRLERLLGGGNNVYDDTRVHAYTNPAKVVRRWLGTSSGAAGDATFESIQSASQNLLPPSAEGRKILDHLTGTNDAAMETSSGAQKTDTNASKSKYLTTAVREVESWLISLAVRLLWKEQKFEQAFDLSQQGIDLLLSYLQASLSSLSVISSSASLFPLLSRLIRYRSLAAESFPKGQAPSLRSQMAQAYNHASLRRDVDSQATLLNCMLRELLQYSQVEQAEKLLSNSTFPETASNNQLCRYLYYSGRIQALRLEYTSSYSNLSQCLRKAPNNTGLGFRIAAQRLLIVVQLLMGEIPERHVFFTKDMKAELAPYLAITQAVRRGDLAVFHQVVSEHASRLQQDGTYTLISRLAHQVVKAGLRKLNISYSRLSLQDVADRLGLPSATSAEFVVAKAVRDGVLEATIHHEDGYVQSHDLVNVYATKEPAAAFHRRIAYCLTTHNDAVRGMRYPPDAYKQQLEASRGQRRKHNDDKTDEEKAQELEDELDGDY